MAEKSIPPVESEIKGIKKLKTGASVRFTEAYSDKPLPAILLVHGWDSLIFKKGSVYDEIAQMLKNEKYHTLALSLRGHQPSKGEIDKVTRQEHEEDIKAAFEYLIQYPEVDSKRVGAFGASYGAYLLSALSSELPFCQLVLRAPALYPNIGWDVPTKTMIDEKNSLMRWRMRPHSFEDSRALKSLSDFKGDLLTISSGKDEQVPPPVAESYRHAIGKTHSFKDVVLPEAKHSLNEFDRKDFLEVSINWFRQHYPKPTF